MCKPTTGSRLGWAAAIGGALVLLLLLLPLVARAQSDTTAPTMTFDPANGQTITNEDTILTVTFSEPVYSDASQTEFTYAQIGKLVTLKRDDINGDNLAFSSSSRGLRNDNTVLRVYPTHTNDLPGQVYFAIGERVSFYDAAGNEGAQANITFTVIQAPPLTKSVIVSPSAPVILDGENELGAFLGVRLGKQPTGNVTVTISASRSANASGANCVSTDKVCIDSDNVAQTQSNKPLTFTTSDWEYFQYVTVSAYSDTDSRNERITLTFDPSGADHGSVAAGTAKITVRDQDQKSVAPSTSALTLDESSRGTFTARLTKQPTGTVAVAVTSSNPDVTVSPTSLSFTGSTWNTAQTVTVTSAADVNIDDEEVYLTLDPSGADYASARTSTVVVNVNDNGQSGLIVSETSLSLNESGSGNTDTFTVKLSENPASDVKVAIGIRAADWKPVQGGKRIATVVGNNTLTFTSENGTTAQTVTITGVVDQDDFNETGTVRVTATGGDFTGLSQDLALTVTDNLGDLSFQVSRNGERLRQITSGPATVIAKVRLLAQPAGNVTVTPSVILGAPVTVSIADNGLFTPQNWDVEKDLTITIGNNSNTDSMTVTLTATGSSEYANKTQTFKVFSPTPPTATIADPGANNVVTVTFNKAVGKCSTKTQTSAAERVCSGTVTAFTNSNIASTFELVVGSADHNNYDTGDAITFTATISGNVATITPTVSPAGQDGEILSLNLLVKDRYWSVGGGVIGSSVFKQLKMQGAQVGNSPPASPEPPLPPVLFGLQLVGNADSSPPNFDGQTLEVKHITADSTACLDVQWGRAANGQDVWTWECNETDAQKWTFEKRAAGDYAGSYRLVSKLSGGNTYCLDNRGDFTTSNRMGIWSCVSDTHWAAANQSVTIAASGDGYTLTFTRGNQSVWLVTDRVSNNPRGGANQTTASGTAGAAAIWRIGSSPPPPQQPVPVLAWAPSVSYANAAPALAPSPAPTRAPASPDAPITDTGTHGPDDLTGAGGDDVLSGGRGDDVLRGLGGDDALYGDSGDDELLGGAGNDELDGGSGDDTYTGGAGADRFVLSPDGPGDKIITDFDATEGDVIVLSAAPPGLPWPSVADIVASVVAQGDRYTVYTLHDGLTVETDTPLRAADFVHE